MSYHVRITRKSNPNHDEVILDLSEAKLRSLVVDKYGYGQTLVVNGTVIPPDDIARIRVSFSDLPSSSLIGKIKRSDELSPMVFAGGPRPYRQIGNAKDGGIG